MTNSSALKEKVINHLDKIKLEELSMLDISHYVGIVKQISDMEQPSYTEMLANMSKNCFGSNYKPVPVEEVSK